MRRNEKRVSLAWRKKICSSELRQRNKVHYLQLQKIIMHEAFFSTKEFYSNVCFYETLSFPLKKNP